MPRNRVFGRAMAGCPSRLENIIMILLCCALLSHGAPIPSPLEKRNLDCVPTQWYHILTFFLINYALHAMTVTTVPGEKWDRMTLFNLGALLLPFTGISRGLDAIRKGAIFRSTAMGRAQKAGALCVVARDPAKWHPMPDEVITGCIAPTDSFITMDKEEIKTAEVEKNGQALSSTHSKNDVDKLAVEEVPVSNPREPNSLDPSNHEHTGNYHLQEARKRVRIKSVNIQGHCQLPPSHAYTLNVLSPTVRISSPTNDRIELPCSYNFVKAVASIVQVLFGAFTLWRARGDQLDRYGYAAFGLTVIPYILMSFINLLGNALTPTYPNMFIIGSEVLDEARKRTPGAEIDGVVGYLPTQSKDPTDTPVLGNASIRFTSFDRKPITVGDRIEWPSKYQIVQSRPSQSRIPTVEVPAIGPHFERRPHPSSKYLNIGGYFLGVIVLATPYVIIGCLTHFDPRNSTALERGFTMSWLVVGQIAGAWLAWTIKFDEQDVGARICIFLTFGILFGAPTIGGMVFVAKMYKEFGACVAI